MVCSHASLSLPKQIHSPHLVQGTKDVRLDPQLNKKVWESGIKGVPFRLRVRISRKRNDEEGAKEKLYSYVQAVNVKNPKGLQTAVVEDA
jgi:Ribosomal protein L31e